MWPIGSAPHGNLKVQASNPLVSINQDETLAVPNRVVITFKDDTEQFCGQASLGGWQNKNLKILLVLFSITRSRCPYSWLEWIQGDTKMSH
jgi:hypothetical protein